MNRQTETDTLEIEIMKLKNIRDSAVAALNAILKSTHLDDAHYIAFTFLSESHNGKKFK